jgi:uncharacterized protein YkwD
MFASMLRLLFLLTLSFALGGCGGGYHAGGPSAQGGLPPNVDVPEDAEAYTTSRGSNGVRGGESAKEAETLLHGELALRGDSAEPDSALAATAAWALRAAYAREELSSNATTDAAHRFGFAGMTLGWIAGTLGQEKTRLSLKDLVTQVPSNTRINRYGIMAGHGRDVVIVLGVVEASLDDFPRSLAPGGSFRLSGDVSDRFERASVFSTNPAGKVREIPMAARAIDAAVEFPAAGIYKLEVMGYGASGPVVLVNVPIHVGVAASTESSSRSEADPDLTSEQAEATLLALLNEERKRRGLPAVAADPELRTVALAHSVDMAEHGFFGHVSPTTGTPENRVTQAHVRVSKVGECVALEITPAGAHRGLMDSPAHRAAMLEPSFTHVGIGVAFVESGRSQRRLAATLLLGRRPPPEDARLTTAETLEAIQAFRKAQKLPALTVDPVLAAAAGAGGRALASGQYPSQALAAAGREMQAQVNRTRVNRSSCQLYLEVLDRFQLAEIPLLKRADIVAIGVGTAPLEDASGAKLGVVLMADGGPRTTVTCN